MGDLDQGYKNVLAADPKTVFFNQGSHGPLPRMF